MRIAGYCCYNSAMKTGFYFALGLFLLAMGATAAQSAAHHHWDWLELVIAVGLAAAGIRALRAGGKRVDSKKAPSS